MDSIFKAIVVLNLILTIGILGIIVRTTDPSYGATEQSTISNPLYLNSSGGEHDASLKIGPNGSTITEAKATTCNLLNTDTSVAASTTVYVYCAVTGVASGDVVFGQLSTTTAQTLSGGWVLWSAKASTTAGMIDFMLSNYTGTAAVPSATGVGSSTNVLYLDV
jgi:hypothetical protein